MRAIAHHRTFQRRVKFSYFIPFVAERFPGRLASLSVTMAMVYCLACRSQPTILISAPSS